MVGQGCGSGSEIFLAAGFGSALERTAGCGDPSSLKAKFKSFRGSSESRGGAWTITVEPIDQWSQIPITLDEEQDPDPH